MPGEGWGEHSDLCCYTLLQVHRPMAGMFLAGVLSTHHVSWGGQGEASTVSGQH